MRLRTFIQLKLVAVSVAIVTVVLTASGCKATQPKPASADIAIQPATAVNPHAATTESIMVSSMAMATSAKTPSTVPVTQPVRMPATEPTVVAEPPIHNAPPSTQPDELDADAALAERFAGIAELDFVAKAPARGYPLPFWKHQEALLNACCFLNPAEGRFPRLVAAVMGQINDRDGESEALQRAIAAKPDDEGAWNRRIDLFLAKMQTADAKVRYLRALMGQGSGDMQIPAAVRAHAGYRCAQTLLERGEDETAKNVLAEALRDCPSSLECLKLHYRMLPTTAPTFERCTQLLDLLRANPLQPQYSTEVADLIASNGLTAESLPWYGLAVDGSHQQGIAAQSSMLNWAVALYMTDQKTDAIRLNAALLKIDPSYIPAYVLQIILTRSVEDKDAFGKAMQQATNAMANRLVDIGNIVAPRGVTKATTRPINDSSPLILPDLNVIAARISHSQFSDMKDRFIEAVADLALLEGYFARQPEPASKLIQALQAILPPDAPLLARLRGWNNVLTHNIAEAKAQFTSAAMQDPLAELGLVELLLANPPDRVNGESLGRRLIAENSSGLMGAILWELLHNDRIKLVTTKPADALRQLVLMFPSELLAADDHPQTIYSVRVDPVTVGPYFGDPVLATVTVTNLVSHNLTLGVDGLIKPQLLFRLNADVATSGSFDAFDNLAGPTVLLPRTQFSQVVRLDQTQLLAFLGSQPRFSVTLTGVLTVNQTVNRMGGYAVQFLKPFLRYGAPPTPGNEHDAIADLTGTVAAKKITALGLLEAYATQLRQLKPIPDSAANDIASLIDTIHHARTDALPAVSAWAAKCEFDLVGADAGAEIARDLAEDPDWRHRQVAALLAGHVAPAIRDDVLKTLLIDPQSSVRAEAKAWRDMAELSTPAATGKTPSTAQ